MSFNFYTLVKYFWVLAFVVCVLSYMTTWDVEYLWRMGVAILMIIIFSVVDAIKEDKKILVRK